MSEISAAIDKLLQQYVTDVLRTAGFKKRARRYSRTLAEGLN